MCFGRPNAIEPTRRTITATLIIPASGGVVTFPPVETKTSLRTTSSFATTLPTTLVIDTSSTPQLPIASTPASRNRSTPTQSTSVHSTLVRSTSSPSTEETFTSTSSSSTSRDTEATTALLSTTVNSEANSITSTSETETETSTEAAGAGAGAGDDKDNQDEKEDGDNKLSTEQVAGISVGVLAAAGVAAGAIVLARYCRRRKYPQIKTGFLPVRDTWGYKPERPPKDGPNTNTNAWIANQIRPPLDPATPPPPPPIYSRANTQPAPGHRPHLSPVSMVASPPPSSRGTGHPSPLRRISKLLPAKPVLPVLPLMIKKENPPLLLKPEADENEHRDVGHVAHENAFQLPPLAITLPAPVASSPTRTKPMPPAPPKLQIPVSNGLNQSNARESTITEFEEDRASLSPYGQVWRPPPTTPISATTYYVADQHGNWVLANSERASQLAQANAQKSQGLQSNNEPRSLQKNGGPLTVSNSQLSLAPPAEIVPAIPRTQGPYPLWSSHPNPRRASSIQRPMIRNLTRPQPPSNSSSGSDVTTINTSSSECVSDDPSPPLEQPVSLSPVAESPRSGLGHSPQPIVPPRDPRRISQMAAKNDSAIAKAAAPPTRPMVYYPPGQPSPTLGMDQPLIMSSSPPPAGPQTRPRPTANPGLETTGSPTMRMVEPSPEPEDRRNQEVAQNRAPPFFFAPMYPQPLASRQSQQQYHPAPRPQPQGHQQPHHQSRDSFQRQDPRQSYSHLPIFQSFQRQPPRNPPNYHPLARPPHPSYRPCNHPHQPYQPYRPDHNQPPGAPYQEWCPPQGMTSNLVHQSSGYRSSSEVSSSNSSLLIKRLGSDRASDMAMPTQQPNGTKWRRDGHEAATPAQPSGSTNWKPRLTPTRRGDDLFLNVQ